MVVVVGVIGTGAGPGGWAWLLAHSSGLAVPHRLISHQILFRYPPPPPGVAEKEGGLFGGGVDIYDTLTFSNPQDQRLEKPPPPFLSFIHKA